ncbi:MAG TPA: hypothetical protein PLL78_12820 [Fimbriimonadaceae bacterium]|nr:hypothetical protein [Fimbriimonadaceae bacterium]HRJ97559.1 hypothetical protein [Fimbriimonadaceae bacterium]
MSDLEITIYNDDFALVKDTRRLNVPAGVSTVDVQDVAARIEPSSVAMRSLGPSMMVLEQNYQYDLMSPEAILRKAIGQRVRFNRVLPDGRSEFVDGVLLSDNGPIVSTDGGRILLSPSGEIEIASIPEGLISRPTLHWLVSSDEPGERDVEIGYLTQGIGWTANYVLTLPDDATGGNIQGWITLRNESGAAYRDARLKMLAGEVNRARRYQAVDMAPMVFAERAAGYAFEEETLFEYHLYTLQRPTTILDREIKQVGLLGSDRVAVGKRLVFDSLVRRHGYPDEGEIGSGVVNAQVRIEFTNDEASGLGIPMPKGQIKVYQRDRSGSVQMLGEDEIGHTARGERISLVVGRAFDVVAERRQVGFRRLAKNAVREEVEIKVRNRKDTTERVQILERMMADWSIASANYTWEKADAFTLRFEFDVGAGQEATVLYSAEFRW